MGINLKEAHWQILGHFGHDLRQPLNVTGLAVGNIRRRTMPLLPVAEQEYLAAKLARIEAQVERARQILDALDEVVENLTGENKA